MPELTPEERVETYQEKKGGLEAGVEDAKTARRRKVSMSQQEGTPISDTQVTVAMLMVLMVLGVVGVAIAWPEVFRSSPGQVASGSEVAEPVAASALLDAYQANEVAADAKYKGRLLEVSGEVWSINKDFLGAPLITLAGIYPCVQVGYGKGHEDWLMKLHKGQRVSVIGRCTGSVLKNVMVEVK